MDSPCLELVMDGRNRIIGLFTRGRRARRSLLSFIHQFDGQHYYFVNLNAICVHLDKDALGQGSYISGTGTSEKTNFPTINDMSRGKGC